MTQREIERTLLRFEGLVRETARQIIAGGVEMDEEDVAQLLRVKVWQAVRKHDETRRRGLPLRRYVFMCVTNVRKDIEKRPRRHTSSIDAIRDRAHADEDGTVADWFDARFLSVDAESVYGEVDDSFELPDDFTPIERQVVTLRLNGYLLLEIDRKLGLSRAQREGVMRSVREKLDGCEIHHALAA